MTKSLALFPLTLALVVPTTILSAQPSALDTVRDFYERYLNYRYNEMPNTPRPGLPFSKSFGMLIAENLAICAKRTDEICGFGADEDVYLDTQEIDPALTFENSGIKFKELDDGLIQVTINVFPAETNHVDYYTRTLNLHMLFENGFWVLNDISYANGASSRNMLREEIDEYPAK